MLSAEMLNEVELLASYKNIVQFTKETSLTVIVVDSLMMKHLLRSLSDVYLIDV